MTPTTTMTVRGRGTLTLPAALREKYGLGEGDPLTVVDLDGAVLLSPRVLVVGTACCRDGTAASSAKAVLEGFGWPRPRGLSRYSSVLTRTS
jgi:AbrB family looped-hinge helix DNA binding protein